MPSPTSLHEHTLELIHLVVDGAASAAQTQELEQILKGSAEARDALESLRTTVRALDALPMMEAPPDLKEKILEDARGRFGASTRVIPFRRRRWILGAAWGTAAAALLAYAVVSRGSGTPDRSSAPLAAGAMVDPDTRTWPLVSQIVAQDPEGAPASLTVRRNGEHILLQMDLRVGRAKSLLLKWDTEKFVLLETQPGEAYLPTGTESGAVVIPPEMIGPISLLLSPREGATGSGVVSLDQEGREIIQTTIQVH